MEWRRDIGILFKLSFLYDMTKILRIVVCTIDEDKYVICYAKRRYYCRLFTTDAYW